MKMWDLVKKLTAKGQLETRKMKMAFFTLVNKWKLFIKISLKVPYLDTADAVFTFSLGNQENVRFAQGCPNFCA